MKVQEIQRAFEALATNRSSGSPLEASVPVRRLDLHGHIELTVTHECPSCGYRANITPNIEVVKAWVYEKPGTTTVKKTVQEPFVAKNEGVVEL